MTEKGIEKEIQESIKELKGDIDLTKPQKMLAGIMNIVIKIMAKREAKIWAKIDELDKRTYGSVIIGGPLS